MKQKLLGIIGLLILTWPMLSLADASGLPNFNLSTLRLGNHDIKVGIGGRFSLEFYQYYFDLNDEIETTPAHPSDSPTGHTTTDLDDNPDGIITRLGLGPRLIIRTEKIYFSGGVDFLFGGFENGYRQGIYDTKLADYGGESYAFTQIIPQGLTTYPYIGFGYNVIDFLLIYGEFGLPINSFKIKTGHDRWGSWETVREDKWEGLGQRYSLGVILVPREKISFGLQVFNERYRVKFFEEDASITAWGANLQLLYQYNLTK